MAEMIDQIWSHYDDDGNGDLDREETKEFVCDYISFLGTNIIFTNENFNRIFDEFDDDQSGSV